MQAFFEVFGIILFIYAPLSWIWPKLLFVKSRWHAFFISIFLFFICAWLSQALKTPHQHLEDFKKALADYSFSSACSSLSSLDPDSKNKELRSNFKDFAMVYSQDMWRKDEKIKAFDALKGANNCLSDPEIEKIFKEMEPEVTLLKEQEAKNPSSESPEVEEVEEAQNDNDLEKSEITTIQGTDLRWDVIGLYSIGINPSEVATTDTPRGYVVRRVLTPPPKGTPCALTAKDYFLLQRGQEVSFSHSGKYAFLIDLKFEDGAGVDRVPFCVIDAGNWTDELSGKKITNVKNIHVDKIVPIAEILRSSNNQFKQERLKYLGDGSDLVLTEDRRGDLEDYIPDSERYQCDYVKNYSRYKVRAKMSFTEDEMDVIDDLHTEDLEIQNGNEEECFIDPIYAKGLLSGRLYGSGDLRKSVIIED